MSKRTRDIKAFHSVDDDLLTQYVELLELRANVASLLFQFKTSPRRRHNMRRNRLMIRALQRNERPTAAAPMLLVPLGSEKHSSTNLTAQGGRDEISAKEAWPLKQH